jgi:hypothetical protein
LPGRSSVRLADRRLAGAKGVPDSRPLFLAQSIPVTEAVTIP